MARYLILGSVLILGAVVLAGCGPSYPSTIPVSGTITLQGKPVEGADVNFIPDAAQQGAVRFGTGRTDAQGKYRLTSFQPNDGVTPGNYRVTVVMPPKAAPIMDASNPSAGYGQMMQQAAAGQANIGEGIPVKYTNPATTDLKAEVTRGGQTEFNFDLQP